jgi:hypothetical protein
MKAVYLSGAQFTFSQEEVTRALMKMAEERLGCRLTDGDVLFLDKDGPLPVEEVLLTVTTL